MSEPRILEISTVKTRRSFADLHGALTAGLATIQCELEQRNIPCRLYGHQELSERYGIEIGIREGEILRSQVTPGDNEFEFKIEHQLIADTMDRYFELESPGAYQRVRSRLARRKQSEYEAALREYHAEKARWEARAGQRARMKLLYGIVGILLIVAGLAAGVAVIPFVGDALAVNEMMGKIVGLIAALVPMAPLFLGWEFLTKDADMIDPLVALEPAPPQVKDDHFLILDSHRKLIEYCVAATTNELQKSGRQKQTNARTRKQRSSEKSAWCERLLAELGPSRPLTLSEAKKLYTYGFSHQLNQRLVASDVDSSRVVIS